ncbi:MAG: 3-oxoacyl-ACP reductase FabG [Proteobacteria bacterium]|jgi:3-oxoacyl-[acyl-carrier protein] reductase|nr:3-oxoacyl-ACP reductase FabG [Pseudomonadota bacterium]
MTSTDQTNIHQVALVTGSSRNIGRAIACALASNGAHIAVHAANDRVAAEETARLVEECGVKAGVKAIVTIGDLTDPDNAPRIINEVISEFGRLDTLVNNAAIRPESPFAEMAFSEWRQVMSVCLDAVFLTTQACLTHLRESKQASIINIGGMTGHTGAVNRAHVVTVKAGIVGFTKALAHELSPQGITVNCVAPGLIDTVRVAKDPSHRATSTNPLGRRGSPKEVADAVAFLSGPSARYITGQTLHVNGGAFLV